MARASLSVIIVYLNSQLHPAVQTHGQKISFRAKKQKLSLPSTNSDRCFFEQDSDVKGFTQETLPKIKKEIYGDRI